MPVSSQHLFAVGAGVAISFAALAVTWTSQGGTVLDGTAWERPSSGPTEGVVPQSFALPLAANGTGHLDWQVTRGSIVVVEVFTSWCEFCEHATKTMIEASRYPRERPVRFIGISLDEHQEQATRVAREWGIPYEVVHDNGTVTRGWNLSALPTVVVLDETGRVHRVANEAVPARVLERWLSKLGAGRLR